MRQYFLLHAFNRFEIARYYTADRIHIVEVEKSNAEGSADVLKNLYCVCRRLVLYQLALVEALLVVCRLWVGNRCLRLYLARLHVNLLCQSVDSASASIVALECVAIWNAC